MNGRIDSGLGQIIIDTDVIATYAGSVAVECFGIVGCSQYEGRTGKASWKEQPETWHQRQNYRGQ